ncbi:MAG: hypothetical protein R2713_12365 [Ilumatobacteraceae bacterium]
MELVEHYVLQQPGFARLPQLLVLLSQQDEVEHLVVRQHDVRWVALQLALHIDQMVGPHRRVRTVFADVEPGGHPGQCRLASDHLGDASRLVAGERIHRIQHQRLDALLAERPLAGAVIEHRKQERLGLARPGTGRDERRLRFVVQRRQPVERQRLVQVRPEVGGHPPERRRPRGRSRPELGAHPQVRPTEDAVALVLQESLQ